MFYLALSDPAESRKSPAAPKIRHRPQVSRCMLLNFNFLYADMTLFLYQQKTLNPDSYFEARSSIFLWSNEDMYLHYVWFMWEKEKRGQERETSLATLLSSLNVLKWVLVEEELFGFSRITQPNSFKCASRLEQPMETPRPTLFRQRLWWCLITYSDSPGAAHPTTGSVEAGFPYPVLAGTFVQ